MEKGSRKRSDILAAGRDLFWKHGVRRVTIQEICREAGVSKMTYYAYFPDKTALAKTLFNDVVEAGERRFREIIEDDSPAADKIRNIILLKAEGTRNISREFLQDFYTGEDSELRTFVENRTREAWKVLLKDFRAAQDRGIFRSDFRPEFIIRVQNKLIEMLDDEELSAMYPSRQELILEFTNLMLYGIAPHD